MEVCGKGWLINWLVWRDIIINPPQFYYSDSSRGSHLLHSPWAPESTVHAGLLPPPYEPIIQNWLEKIADRKWVAHGIVLSQAHVGWGVEGDNSDLELGSPSLKLPVGYLGAKGLKKYSYQLQPAPLLQLIADLLQAREIWHLVNWWEGRMATARYAVQKLQLRCRTSGEGGNVTAPVKGHIMKESIFIILLDLTCLKYSRLSNSMTLERFWPDSSWSLQYGWHFV